jgi:FkbM family methyltransferase
MLIPLQEVVAKYNLKITGVCHVGGHYGQEYEAYKECGAEPIIFIEPCKKQFQVLYERFGNMTSVYLKNFALGSTNTMAVMNVDTTNQGQSNSIMTPKVHLEQHPDVLFNGEPEIVEVKTLDSIMKLYDNAMVFHFINMLMIDTQGYELEVLKGGKDSLDHFEIIYAECNRAETYEGCPMVEDLDEFLKPYKFKRVETKWASDYHSWGDCVYLKEYLLP